MNEKSVSRESLGLLLRRYRERKNLKRLDLAKICDLEVKVIIHIEHGVKNPTRSDFKKVIKCLNLPADVREKAGRLLRIIHPRQRIKFHLHITVLRKRQKVYRVRV